jgi:hypothetical protein
VPRLVACIVLVGVRTRICAFVEREAREAVGDYCPSVVAGNLLPLDTSAAAPAHGDDIYTWNEARGALRMFAVASDW